jgi:hypothetical protein
MNEGKVRALKLQVQESAVKAARAFYEVERDETGHGRCGECGPCQESMANLSKLFFKAMERELSALYLAEIERDVEANPLCPNKDPSETVNVRAPVRSTMGGHPKDRLN